MVPAGFLDQWVLGRSSVNDSPVWALKIWSVAPLTVGSSPLPGVGSVKPSLATNVSRSRPDVALRASFVPGIGWSAPCDGRTAVTMSARPRAAPAARNVISCTFSVAQRQGPAVAYRDANLAVKEFLHFGRGKVPSG